MQIYLGNLAPEVDESLLFELVSQLAPVASVRMPRNKSTREHQGYGFAVFADSRDAAYVLELVAQQPIRLYGRPLRARAAAKSTDQRATRSELHARTDAYEPRIFVGNLAADAGADPANLSIPFGKFGSVESVEYVAGAGASMHAFVKMGSLAETKAAIAGLNDQLIMNRRIRVELER